MAYASTKKDADFYESLGPENQVNRDRPKLDEESLPWWDVYQMLHLSRAVLFDGPGAIPLTEIEAYCRLTDVTEPSERTTIFEMVRAIDTGYLELVEERNKRKGST